MYIITVLLPRTSFALLSFKLSFVILGLVGNYLKVHNNGLELTSPLAKQYNTATRRPYHWRVNSVKSCERKTKQ